MLILPKRNYEYYELNIDWGKVQQTTPFLVDLQFYCNSAAGYKKFTEIKTNAEMVTKMVAIYMHFFCDLYAN